MNECVPGAMAMLHWGGAGRGGRRSGGLRSNCASAVLQARELLDECHISPSSESAETSESMSWSSQSSVRWGMGASSCTVSKKDLGRLEGSTAEDEGVVALEV